MEDEGDPDRHGEGAEDGARLGRPVEDDDDEVRGHEAPHLDGARNDKSHSPRGRVFKTNRLL